MNSRNSIRWRLAIAAFAIVFLGVAIPFHGAVAGAEGDGRLVASHPAALPNDQQVPGDVDAVPEPQIVGASGGADDGDLIHDDSDVASVDGSANDDGADPAVLFGGSY